MSIIRPREIVCLLLGLLLVVAMIATGQSTADAATTDDVGAFSATKTVTRQFTGEDGAVETIDSRDVTVKVDHTLNLRGRERVAISWSGAHPSGGRASDPYGENGLKQEYPMVIMQCRGIDDPALPAAQRVDPTTCWTSTRQQRSQSVDDVEAVWRHDLHSSEEMRAKKSGLDSIPESCSDVPANSTHVTPFASATGTTYAACDAATMPPEAAVGASFPPAEVAGFTDLDGNGSVNYEVRSATENESLGCSTSTPCSIVAIPIMGLSCIDDNSACQATGRFRPGASNFASEGVDAAVSPVYWWSQSNWRNRISVPLSFGLPPDACTVLDSRAPTAFYGSELMNQASLQWAPAYCLSKKRFKFQHNRLGDEPAFSLVEKGGAPAAFVSGGREAETTERIGYAPTAVTGFAVAYSVDEPENRGERGTLKLTPRLLAKLLTQSYAGSTRGQQHPGMEKNPLSINQDPEFQALNPGLDSIAREAAASVLSLSDSSDVVKSMTSYIANDSAAMAFVKGQVDPWGMAVNPTYKSIKLPVSEFPLLDTFVPTSGQVCQQQNTTPYFTLLAAPINSITKIAQAVLDGWPNTQTRCEGAGTASEPFKTGRIDRQGIGSRFMLGIVSLGDAQRYGLRTASLQTGAASANRFVAPTSASLAAAVKVAEPKNVRSAFDLSQKDLRKVPAAYPGTMIVYTVAKLDGMDKDDAAKVASFIRIATTEGQVTGSGNGKLPAGYLPIVKSGATADLYAQAQKVAKLVEAQKAPAAAPTKAAPTKAAAPAPAAVAPVGSDTPIDEPVADVPVAATADVTTVDTLATASTTSGQAQNLMPVLLAVLLAAGLGGPATRLVAEWRRRR
jgi:hypothetical protein